MRERRRGRWGRSSWRYGCRTSASLSAQIRQRKTETVEQKNAKRASLLQTGDVCRQVEYQKSMEGRNCGRHITLINVELLEFHNYILIRNIS